VSESRGLGRKALVVIPALNESKALPSTLSQFSTLSTIAGWDITAVVIDDGSTDGTSEVASKAGILCLRHPVNCGVGAAMRTGFKYALSNGYDAVVQVDADGQHPINEISNLISSLDDCDVVVGSRFLAGPWEASVIRKMAMKFLGFLVKISTGKKFTDPTSGFRVAGPRAIKFFAENYPSEYLGDTVESLVLAHRHGLKMKEIPASLELRQNGVASHTPARAGLHVFRAAGMIILTAGVWRTNPQSKETVDN
jgi:glycosyltransferase involved in cell wall biosynthesis